MSPKKWSDMPPYGISYSRNGNNYNIQWGHTNENQNESSPGRPTDWAALGLGQNFGHNDYYYTVNVLIKDINGVVTIPWQNIDVGQDMTYPINITKEDVKLTKICKFVFAIILYYLKYK